MPEIDIKPLTDRVVIDHLGRAVRPDDAFYNHGVCSKIIFVRGDGWAVGTPEEFEDVTYRLWQKEWREFRVWPNYEPQPIGRYKPKRKKRR